MNAYPKTGYWLHWKSIPWVTLGLAVIAWAIHRSPTLTSALQFDRVGVAQGELWRFITAHLTHFGADHLRWDLLAFVVLGTMAERVSRAGHARTLALSSAVITAGVWVGLPQFQTYRGLSGVDSALFGFVIADVFVKGLRARHAFSIVVSCVGLLFFAAKCAFELSTGGTVFVDTTGAVAAFTAVPLAHLLGMLSGAMVRLSCVDAKVGIGGVSQSWRSERRFGKSADVGGEAAAALELPERVCRTGNLR